MATENGGVYFPVDSGFCDTTTARQVTRKLGHQGFHAYVALLCCLLNEPDGRLPLELADEWDDLTKRLGLPLAKTKELVAIMEHYGMLEHDGGCVVSPLVMAGIAERRKRKTDAVNRGKRSAEARAARAAAAQGDGQAGTEEAPDGS